MNWGHESVLLKEVVELFAQIERGVVLDATVGTGGHAEAILRNTPGSVKVLAMDLDMDALQVSSRRLAPYGDRVLFVHGGFEDVPTAVKRAGIHSLAGVLADMGLSSRQLQSGRGFSFKGSEPLDMRFAADRGPTAMELLGRLSERELARAFRELGQLRRSVPLAREIKRRTQAGRMCSTSDLREACEKVLGKRYRGVAAATVPFMVLRMLVNQERERLQALLREAPNLLSAGGVMAIIAFHSTEDSLVKARFRELAASGAYALVWKRPRRPERAETVQNPRARTARLRAIRKVRVAQE